MQAAATLRREILSPASTETVRRDGFASTLFLLPWPRPGAPAVVVIGGSGGGEDILTAQALAMTGYPALALGYFQEPGLPKCLCDIPLGYFARAVRWLRAQPIARGRPIDRYGVSRGAEAALLIASYEPRLFDAVIASSPSNLINPAYGGGPGAAWTFRGKALPTDAIIPVGRMRVPLLVGDGGADVVWRRRRRPRRLCRNCAGPGNAPLTRTCTFLLPGTATWGFRPISPFPPTGPRETLSVAARRLTLWLQSSSGPR